MRILVALGGNAILKRGEAGTAEEQLENVRKTSRHLAGLIQRGHHIAITHGNGPQVGDILLRNELAKNTLPVMPLDVCGAESQGMIGYMLQQTLHNELRVLAVERPIATILTQSIVDRNDPAFSDPTKPIGPFYTEEESSKLRKERGWTIMNDSGRGYRRVVPSPKPVEIPELPIIREMFELGFIIVQCGGGGIPVVRREDGELKGVEAVIDKDLCASLLASQLGVDVLLILTDVEMVSLNFGKPNQLGIARMSVEDCNKFMAEGQFPPGSMGPKIEAAVNFVISGGRKRAIISSLEKAELSLEGRAGTTISSPRVGSN